MLPCYTVEYFGRGTYYDCAWGGVLESRGGWVGVPVLESDVTVPLTHMKLQEARFADHFKNKDEAIWGRKK